MPYQSILELCNTARNRPIFNFWLTFLSLVICCLSLSWILWINQYWRNQIFCCLLLLQSCSPKYMLFIYRLPFTMLVLQKSVKMVWSLPEVMRVAYAFMFVMLLWMGLWSFGAAGVVASSLGESGCWWLLVVSWQVLLLIPSVIVTRIARNFHWNEPELVIILNISFVHPGSLCKLILDWCSPL